MRDTPGPVGGHHQAVAQPDSADVQADQQPGACRGHPVSCVPGLVGSASGGPARLTHTAVLAHPDATGLARSAQPPGGRELWAGGLAPSFQSPREDTAPEGDKWLPKHPPAPRTCGTRRLPGALQGLSAGPRGSTLGHLGPSITKGSLGRREAGGPEPRGRCAAGSEDGGRGRELLGDGASRSRKRPGTTVPGASGGTNQRRPLDCRPRTKLAC